jgi:hypothetical protein
VTDVSPLAALDLAEATEVRPGDTLIVRVSTGSVTWEQADLIKETLQHQLPGVQVVVVAAAGIAVYRPEAGVSPCR